MKTLRILFSGTLVLTCTALFAQVQIDKPIQLTGTSGDRIITGLELPVNGSDATNKDYVDAAVAAAGGSAPTMLSVESSTTMNKGDAVRYCYNLTEVVNTISYDDWHLPSYDELMSVISKGGNYVPNDASTNFFWLTDYDDTQRLDYYGSYGINYRMSDGFVDTRTTGTVLYARCVR